MDGPRPSTDGDAQPLAGLRVLDMTTFLSGPFATQILADLGAEVIKVESPAGDSSRRIPPHFVGPDSAYFFASNRSKRSVVVDLKSPEGAQIARRLVLRSDVVVENFRPGVCERLGLSSRELRRQRPGLIWASVSGFGQTGPWRHRPAYDMVVQALSGVMSLTGEVGGPSVRVGVPIGDLVAGMYAVIGVLAAVADRERSGRGRDVDVAMLDSQLAMLSYQAAYAGVSGQVPAPQGRGHDSIVTYRSFTGGDGRELVVTAITEQMWRDLCHVLGRPELPDDPDFADAARRLQNRHRLWPELEAAFLEADAESWVERLVANHVPAALIKTVPEALADADGMGRGMVVEFAGAEGGGPVRVAGNPIKYIDEAAPPPRNPPALGQDTEQVLREVLGLEAEEISRLRDSQAVTGAERPSRR